MVSFKSSNLESEQTTPYRHLPGTLRVSLNHSHSHSQNPTLRHELHGTPPPANYPVGQHGCAIHPRLDQPVTSSSTGMDGKKLQNVQASSSPASGQVRIKGGGGGGGDGTSAISGVRRKSGPQGLRSPAAKRPLSAPVALQGWLYKQGSEGLMLWKKRWFVLSEYCLFYYKGPEEEKLLGSILLPSYRVTVCRPEDKVNKKFAFKAEHANMRTYHFAAETRESMNQWVNALTLASLLQDPNPRGDEASSPLDMAGPADGDRSARPSVSSISSILNQSADDSDSGFHGFQSRDDPSHTSNNNSSPNSVNTASFPNLNNNGNTNGSNNGPNEIPAQMNGWMQQSPQYGQPGPSQQYNQFQIAQPHQPHQHQTHQTHQSHQSHQSVQSHSQVLQSHSQVLQSQTLQSQTLQTHQVLQSHSQVLQSQTLQTHSQVQILQPHNQVLQNSLQSGLQTGLQNNLQNSLQTGLQNSLQTGLQSGLQNSLQTGLQNSLQTGLQNSLQNSLQTGLQTGLQTAPNSNVVQVQPMPRNYCQPVYANTKPKRYTEGTSSPDPDYRKSPVSPDIRMTSKSPMNEYERNIYGTRGSASQQQQQQQQQPQQQQQQPQATLRTDKSGLNYGLNYNQERRTPDTYGRSAKPRNNGGRGNGDYEDVYGAPQLYQRPAGPVGYTKAPAPAPIPIPVYAQQVQHQQVYNVSPQVAPVMRQARVHPPPRPHSADFLEYEANRRPDQQTLIQSDSLQNQSRRPQRPKSSLDIVNPSDTPANDNYFYSEERYAAQMRQSAVYIHQTPQHHQQQRNQSLSRATTPSMTSNRDRDVESGIGTLSENSCSGIRRGSRGDHMQHIISSQPLQRHNDLASNEALLRRSLRERSYEPAAVAAAATSREMLIHNESGTVPRRMPRDYDSSTGVSRTTGMTSHVSNHSSYGSPACHTGPRRWNEQQFARSASARLPRTRHPAAVDHEDDDDEYNDRSSNHDSRDGERKIQQREESMKRLLEWKQRMLQSPLTRKPSGSTNRGTAQNELSNYYKQQALLDLAAHEASVAEARHSRRRDESHRPHVRSKSSDGRRSVTNVSRYNSYSSDDEASQSGSVIGRDPLPSRAVSTSQLPQKSLTQSPPTQVSTLPLPRNSGSSHRQQPLLVHQSTPQSTKQSEHGALINSQILKAASSGDVRLNSALESRISSPSGQSSQRLMSPASHLRVISPIDHRVSSPSDSERQLHSPSERSVTSPLRREVDRGGGDLRQIQRVRECIQLLHKRARLVELDTPSRLENLQKQEKLEKHLMDLEKEYEKGKPLENLVANMLKLGSLYNRSTANGSVSGSRHDLLQENTREYRDRLEFNQRVEEQRLLAQERRDWDRLSPDHGQLQAKVHQLFKTDRLLQEESATVHSLQQDKEILQKALESLRYKLQGNRNSPAEVEHYRLLERELSKVRMLLAHHSKKLEETVAENDRLEQDLVVLRQKLQPSRRYVGSMTRDSTGTTAAWEAELAQQHVSDLKRQRQELSNQIRQLKEQIRPQASTTPQVHHSKKRAPSSWLETDLDSGITRDHGMDNSPSSPSSSSSPHSRQIESPPQYISQNSPPYKEPLLPYKESSYRYSPPRLQQQQQQQQQQHSTPNHITTLSPQLREQIQQHQLKQQLLKDQIQGKSSPIQNNIPLYVNTEARKENKHYDSPTNNEAIHPPEYIPPPPPPPPSDDALLLNGNYGQDDNKFSGLIHGREKQEIKTVRIVKRESERRQRDRGDRTGGLGIPLTNGLSAPGGAKRLGEDEFGGSQHFEKAQLGKVVEESPMAHAQSTVQLSEIDDVQFQRSMSLPRGFGGQRPHPAVHQAPVLPPPRSDSMNALKNMIARRHRVRFENQDGSSDSTLSPYTDSPSSSSYVPMSSPNYSTSPPYSPSQQNYQVQQSIRSQQQLQQQPVQYYPQYGSSYGGSTPSIRAESLGGILSPGPMSPTAIPSVHERLFGSAASLNGLGESPPQLSPVFKSEAAKQIIKEMTEKKLDTTPRRRQVPKEKRRHYTVSSSKPIFDLEDTFTKMGMGRARDDLDMERALRPRINAPDVVRSTLSQKELKYNESTIDQLLGTPNKIVIPERYIPEKTPELTAEEREQRLKKVESIRKMLSETVVTATEGGEDEKSPEKSGTLKQKVEEEKRQREHILQLNQILAKQVMEKSKMVAVKALATLPLDQNVRFEDDDLSPLTPLPLYQQRENFYS
ncbi:uncharacterized protein LOC122510889 isoform X5 [Leptopilina heterotoma]|uniref:uncharacterized protein LOC122510889 isoform X5 n=1 Tax=Leptopilina heterotoma TaxID=63436 RepID=UPI001CA83295|nr:uncharacterized protein LOC122510889 isoform X5 [Leptopilina heterotoma]